MSGNIAAREAHSARVTMSSEIRNPWPAKTPGERIQCLETVKTCGERLVTWECTAAMLGVNQSTLWRWRKKAPEIDAAYAMGKQVTGAKIAQRLEAKALDPEEEGNTQALLHMSKHYLAMGDKSTQTVVTPEDLAPGEDEDERKERRSVALSILGLSALDGVGDGD